MTGYLPHFTIRLKLKFFLAILFSQRLFVQACVLMSEAYVKTDLWPSA